MTSPRTDTRGILWPARMHAHARFRRHSPDPALADIVEHYWLSDWDLPDPHPQQVLTHPTVNMLWATPNQHIVTGAQSRLSTTILSGKGRVFGIQFPPGGFRAFTALPLSDFTDRQIPIADVFGTAAEAIGALLADEPDDLPRVAAVNRFLLAHSSPLQPSTVRAMRLAKRARTDRGITRVETLAATQSLSVRSVQRLFADEIGVSPKWVIRRYRTQEAIEVADDNVDWAMLANDLGYVDQAHLVRDFSAAAGISPAAYQRSLRT
ncbi:MAG: AraC family transcriptional regulator [Stackebrandtia sp.]